MIEASVICDSLSTHGKRLTTFKLRYPKFIHGEFMTHRVISRNASSSRAVPTKKLLEEVRSDELRATPSFSVINAPGMQGGRASTEQEREDLRAEWKAAALEAADRAQNMFELGGAKQDVNRCLEAYSHINTVASATEWDNFFGLRLHKDAQPEMRALAIAMWQAYTAGEPKILGAGEWHLPFVDENTENKIIYQWAQRDKVQRVVEFYIRDTLIKVSVARCARVSYESFETGKRSTIEEDLKLYDRLLGAQPLHASPAEHQGTPSDDQALWGNFKGWTQFRKTLQGEALAPIPTEFL